MKQLYRLFLITTVSTVFLFGCGKDEQQVVENDPATTEQVAFDDVEVEDYTVLKYSELEVLAYEGDVDAQVQLGRMSEYGTEDVKQDFADAISWYQMAADSGYAEGTCALGYFYLTGTGVEQDLEKAQALFSEAIAGGSVNAYVGQARVMLSQLSLDFDTPSTEDLTEEEEPDEEDEELAEQLTTIYENIHKAAVAGDLDGAYYLGYCYEKGIGVLVDYKKAFDFYTRAAKSESTALEDKSAKDMANTALGLLYMKGEGVEADTDSAIEYFKAASDNGYPKADYYLGQIYENGLGVDKDYEEAMEYYLKAAEQSYAPALNQLGYMYYNGYGVDVDFASAVYYQKLAALQGYAIAQVNLGFLYENGYGVERNLETALAYYEMAAESGYEGATEAVVRVKAQINEEM